MGYQVYECRGRDCGYGVPAECDKPDCYKRIDRGLAHLCGDAPGDEQFGCGLYFCDDHLSYRKPRGLDHTVTLCPRCWAYKRPWQPKSDLTEWIEWKLTDESWQRWRDGNPDEVEALARALTAPKKQRSP